MKERYEEKVAEGKERMEALKIKADEKKNEMRGRYDERVTGGKERMDELKTRADEKKKNFEDKMEGWRKKK